MDSPKKAPGSVTSIIEEAKRLRSECVDLLEGEHPQERMRSQRDQTRFPATRFMEGEMISATQLRIHPINWPLANDYRVVGDQLQMRLTDERYGIRTQWRTLTEDEWAAHDALQTVVAQWFRDKLGFSTVPHAENN